MNALDRRKSSMAGCDHLVPVRFKTQSKNQSIVSSPESRFYIVSRSQTHTGLSFFVLKIIFMTSK